MITEGSCFDFVIIGGGTAGCVLAARLSEDPDRRVLLIEAGTAQRSVWTRIPAGFTKVWKNAEYNWQFWSEPSPGVADRRIAIPRGKGLGGSTLINGMIYVRGQRQDYDAWSESFGLEGWGWNDVAPYFVRLERSSVGDAGRGREGPLHVVEVAERHTLSEAFMAAAQQAGHCLNVDYNGESQEGFGYYQVTQQRGTRCSLRDAYLDPCGNRPNLLVMSDTRARRLLLEGGRCTGVELALRQGGRRRVYARHEVVLCAGAIQSPQLLELSGVGDPALLQSFGIGVQAGLPAVGEYLKDHAATRMNWRVRGTRTLNEMTRGIRLLEELMKYARSRSGALSLGTGLGYGFLRTGAGLTRPDAQYFFMHASYANAAERKLDRLPGMTLGVSQLRPRSRGHVHIRSPELDDPPRIFPNLLGDESDVQCLVGAMKEARRIFRQPAMLPYVASELSPGSDVRSEDEWVDFCRQNAQTIYHPVGTCRMGTDRRESVVNARLKVHGVAGLRIADASVMPDMVSGNTQAAVMMIAEKAADMIREDLIGKGG